MEWYEKAARLTESNARNLRYSETGFTKILIHHDTDKSNSLNQSEIHALLTKMLKRYKVEITAQQSQEIFAAISTSETIKMSDFAKKIVGSHSKKTETYTRLLANMLGLARNNPVYCIENDPFSNINAQKPILVDFMCNNNQNQKPSNEANNQKDLTTETSKISDVTTLETLPFAKEINNSLPELPIMRTPEEVEGPTAEETAKLIFTKKYEKDHPNTKFSGVVGLFASTYNRMPPAQNGPSVPNFGNSIIANNATLTAMPLANVQYVQTIADKTNMEDAKQFGDNARKTTEAALAGSWRFHWGYENPLLLTPRRASIAQNLPVIRTKTDEFGIEQKKYIGTFNIAAGLMPNDPLLTSTRDKIYPGTKPVGDCACVGGLENVKLGEDTTKPTNGVVCEIPKKPEMRKPNSTVLAFNPDSGEFGITGISAGYANKQWRFTTSVSPKGLPKFKPSPWNEMPKPVTNVFAGNVVATYKPKENVLLGAQISTFGQENRVSLIGRTFWKNGTNAALALDYGTMPNRTRNAILEPMGLARLSVEVPIGKSLDIAALGSVGRYYDSKTNFADIQINATYNPYFKFKYPTAFNVSMSKSSRYKTSINAGIIMNIK